VAAWEGESQAWLAKNASRVGASHACAVACRSRSSLSMMRFMRSKNAGHAEAVRLLLTNGAERHPLDMVCHGRVLSRAWCFHVRIPLGACSAQQERSPANLARLRSHSLVMELLPELAIALPTAPAEPYARRSYLSLHAHEHRPDSPRPCACAAAEVSPVA
jgi:hypothetical protein